MTARRPHPPDGIPPQPNLGGRRAVAEAVRAGRASRVFVQRGVHRTQGLRELLDAAERSGVDVTEVDPRAFERWRITDHQGVAATVTPPRELDDRGLATATFDGDALVVVLDGIMDPHNLGAAARTAEAAGASMLVSRRRRAAPLTDAAVRASAGALLHLPSARVTNIARTLEELKDRGFFVVGLDAQASATIHEADPPPRPVAVVLGSEGEGLARLTREACDLLLSIPMSGRTASLNASVALAVALFAYVLRPSR